jgi:hypothetical protein
VSHVQCLSPARAQRPIDAPIGSSMYGRLFPDLPSFSAEQELLFALGRAGGLCACGDEADEQAAHASEAAGWPFFGKFIVHEATRSSRVASAGTSAASSCRAGMRTTASSSRSSPDPGSDVISMT